VHKARHDYEYMREWSERLGIRGLLDKAIAAAS
jgi:hypothetical protein